MDRDPDFLRADALAATDALALPEGTAPAAVQAGPVQPAVAAQLAVLLGFADDGAVALVLAAGDATARRAETLLPLRGEHIGRRVAVLPLHGADAGWLVIGLLAGQPGWPPGLPAPQGHVEVQADGSRMSLQARDELTLRCGKSVLTLRSDGRIEIRGETIVSQAVRANRVRGGSVELN